MIKVFKGFFDKVYYGDLHKPDTKADDILKKSFPLLFDIFYLNFWQLIKLNLLLIVFSMPVITIGPALAGFNSVLRNYILGRSVWLWDDYKNGVVKNLKQSLILTVINTLVVFALLNYYRFYININNNFIKITGSIIITVISFIFALINIYTYPMMITYDLKIRHIFKNAFIFSIIKLPQTVGILLICISILAISMIIGFVPLIFISFSLIGLIINAYDKGIFEKYFNKSDS